MAERALVAWLRKRGPAYFGLKQSFVISWANQNGVVLPRGYTSRGSAKCGLEKWVVEQGPGHFGLNWNFDTALLQELQVTGKAAEIAAQLSEK
jgi:hypothetical protein